MWNVYFPRSGLLLATLAAEVVAYPDILVARQATSTSSTPVATPTPNFLFLNDDIIQPVTCQSVRIAWSYDGPQGTINLYVTNVNVFQAAPPSSSSSTTSRPTTGANQPTTITKSIGTILNPDVSDFLWSPVNVPSGWYIFNASLPSKSYSTTSLDFYVRDGNDTSCLLASSTAHSTSSSSSYLQSASSSFIPLRTSEPSAVGASNSNTTSLGVVLGASLGGAALLAVILFLSCFLYFKRKRSKPTQSRGADRGDYTAGGGGAGPHHWKGLGSADSRDRLRQAEPRSHRANDSMGTVISSDEAAGIEKSSIHSKMDSTVFTHEPESTLPVLPVLLEQPTRTTRHSVIDRPRSTGSLGSSGDNNPSSPRRVLVRDESKRSMDSMTYPPTSPTSPFVSPLRNSIIHNPSPTPSTIIAHDESGTVRRTSTPTSTLDSATPTITTPNPTNRQSMGRKRKPVPAYDEAVDFPTSSPTALLPPSSFSVPPSPLPVVLSSSPFSSPAETYSPPPSSNGHYVTRNQSLQDFKHPELAHKNSFGPGAKPMHFIIPDMPLPTAK